MDQRKQNSIIILFSLLSIIAGLIIITGWLFNIPALSSLIVGGVPMRFNAALCFVLFGSALLITQYEASKYTNLLFFILSLPGTLIGLITLFQYLFHFNCGLDSLFINDKTILSPQYPYPGRMSFSFSVNCVFFGSGLLLLKPKRRLSSVISQILFQTVTVFSAVSLINYLYGAALFLTIFKVNSMRLHAAFLFFTLSIGASLLNPSVGIARLFTGKKVGNRMAKRLYTVMSLMVILFGSLSMQFHNHPLNLVSLETSVAVLAIAFLLLSLLLIWNTANWLNKLDRQRNNAEEKIKLMNAGLEKMVQERTAEFKKSEEKYHSLIEQASDAIYIMDFERNFTDVNASMCKMMGYSRDELLQLKVEAIVDQEELKTDPFPETTPIIGRSTVRERRFKRKDGQVFTVEINVKPFTDDRIMVIARDITYRKKMENELRDAELKFRTVAEKSMVGVYIVQKGKFVYVNPRFAQIFGYAPHELINTFPLEIIIDESYRKITTEHVRRRMEGEVESINYEAKGKKKDGTTNWVEFYGSRAIIGNEPTIIGSMIDITERKKVEEQLRYSRQKYKLLFDSNPMPLWMIAKDDQTVIAVNDATTHLYGYKKEELLQMNATSLRPKEDIERQLAGYKVNFEKSNGNRIVRHIKKDGTIISVRVISHDIIFEGRPVRLSMTIDITENLKAEKALQKSEANLQAILKTTDTAYALLDTDLKVQAFNPKAVEFIKKHYDHIPEKGEAITDHFPRERFPRFKKFAKDVLQGNNINYEVDYPQADGSVLWYYVRLFPIINDNKETLGMLMALYDITERKNVEQDLKSAYEKIQNHINSIKDMAWKQSHLIRSPLANLKALIVMQKDDPSDPIVFDHIQHELHRMDDIIIQMAKDASAHE